MKQRLISLLLILCIIFGMVSVTAAAEGTESLVYDSETGILFLKNHSGSLPDTQLQVAKLVVAEGTNTVTQNVYSADLKLIVLPGASVTFCGSVTMKDVLLVVGQGGKLSIGGLYAENLYTAGPGEIAISSTETALKVPGTAVLQQNGVLTVQGGQNAVEIDKWFLTPGNRIFLSENAKKPAETYDGGTYLRVQPYMAVDKPQKQVIVDEQTQEETPVVVFEAPEAAAATAEVGILACYDDNGRMLGLAEGACSGGQWTFEDPGYAGQWRVFFAGGKFVPQCEAYPVEVAGEQTPALCSADSSVSLMAETEENYETAIDLVWALRLINGYEDGDFHPERNVTRAEAATITARLANSSDDISKLYASAGRLKDVAETDWFASFVNYCDYTGIISHMIKNNKYKPFQKTTLPDFAGMLLVVLGYDADAMGFWDEERILQEAEARGLLDDIPETVWREALTRGRASQLIRNALWSEVVIGTLMPFNEMAEQLPKTGAEFKLGAQADPWIIQILNGELGIRLDRYGRLVLLSDDLLGPVLYPALEYSDTCDPWGRPGRSMTMFDKNQIRYTETELTQVQIHQKTADVNLKQVLAQQTADGYRADLYVDGQCFEKDVDLTGEIAQQWSDYTGNGIVTEIYADDTAKTVTVVIINTWLVQVTSIEGRVAQLTRADGIAMGGTRSFDYAVGDWFLAQQCSGGILLDAVTLQNGVVKSIDSSSSDVEITFSGETQEYKVHSSCADLVRQKTMELMGQEIFYCIGRYGYVFVFIPEPETQPALFLWDTLEMTKSVDATSGMVYQYTGKMVSFASDPMPERTELTESAYQSLQEKTADTLALITVTNSGTMDLVETAQAGNASVNGRIVTVNDTVLYLTDSTQILTRTKNAATEKYEYAYYDGVSQLTQTIPENCPCQYLADGKNLTYVFFDLTAVSEAPVQEGNVLVLSYEYSQMYNPGDGLIQIDLYKAVCNGEEVCFAFKEQLIDENEQDQIVGVYRVSYTKSQDLTHEGMPIYLVEGSPELIKSCELSVKGDMVIVDGAPVQLGDNLSIVIAMEDFSGVSCTAVESSEFALMMEDLQTASICAWIVYSADGEILEMYVYVSQ